MSLTPLGLMIGPLNHYLGNPSMSPLDAAEHILERLRQHEYVVVHEPCDKPWTACGCSQAAPSGKETDEPNSEAVRTAEPGAMTYGLQARRSQWKPTDQAAARSGSDRD